MLQMKPYILVESPNDRNMSRDNDEFVVLSGAWYYEINSVVPMFIRMGGGNITFEEMVQVKEIHITKDHTLVFYERERTSSIKSSSMMEMFRMNQNADTGRPRPASYASSSGSGRTSTMDPALAMSLGMDRTPRDIAARQHRTDGTVTSIADAMRMAGNPIFDDDDDF